MSALRPSPNAATALTTRSTKLLWKPDEDRLFLKLGSHPSVMSIKYFTLRILVFCTALAGLSVAGEPRGISGSYPHLAMFNNEGECGTGAVVPWA